MIANEWAPTDLALLSPLENRQGFREARK